MSDEPSYPKDAPVGEPAPEAVAPAAPKRTRHLMQGAAIGIGSAAIVAALMYATRSKKDDKDGR